MAGTDAFSSLITTINSIDVDHTAHDRNVLVLALRNALAKVESPWQRMQAMVWEQTCQAAALKIAHDVGMFKHWSQQNADGIKSLEEISSMVQPPMEKAILERVISALTYTGVLANPAPNQFQPTTFSKSLAEPNMAACLDYWFQVQIPALSHFPTFLQSTAYTFPRDTTRTAWNLATNDSTPFFDWLQQRPEVMGGFAQVMHQYADSQIPWVDLYPTEKLIQGSSVDDVSPLVVDIGGSFGHDLLKFVNKHQPPFESCYLQDRPEVIETADVSAVGAIVKQAHDIFKVQPVRGARAYYLHNILHDWTDEQCVEILMNIKAAMEPSRKSRVLVHELVRKEGGASDLTSLGEFTVLSILGSQERSETEWRTVAKSAGFQVTGIHRHDLSTHSIMELELE